jgi:hypothetical protein
MNITELRAGNNPALFFYGHSLYQVSNGRDVRQLSLTYFRRQILYENRNEKSKGIPSISIFQS